MKNHKIILTLLFLGFFITSCNTGIDGRYKLAYSSFMSGEYYFDEDGTCTFEVEVNENPINGSWDGKDEGTWWLDTLDLNGTKVNSVEYMKDPDQHLIYLGYEFQDGIKYFKLVGRDWWYPELWKDGEVSCYKTFFPF